MLGVDKAGFSVQLRCPKANAVVPACAGTQSGCPLVSRGTAMPCPYVSTLVGRKTRGGWIPAFAGMIGAGQGIFSVSLREWPSNPSMALPDMSQGGSQTRPYVT